MAVGVLKAWSLTAADNGASDTNINFAEGQSPASLNNSMRAEMSAIKGWANQISGAKTTGGSANAQTLTSDSVAAISTAYAAGMAFVFKAGYTNSATATLNVDGVGAKTIKKGGAQAALAANDIVAGGIYFVAYEASGDCFILLNPETGQVALDATLTALAALSWSSGSPLLQFTAADTVSLTLTPSVTSITVSGIVSAPDGSAAAPSIKVGDEQNGLYSPSANVLGLTIAGTQRFSITSTVFDASLNGGIFRIGAGTVGAPAIVVRAADTDTGFWSPATDTWAWSAVGVEYMRWTATLAQFVMPIQAPLAVSSETSGTLTSASANKQVNASAGVTINDGVFAANDWVFIENSSGSSIVITQDTGMTLRLHGTAATTGNRTLAAYGGAAIRFKTNADAIVYGDVT